MDWLQRLERRKLIRKLAGRMLLKDLKAMVFSWKVIFLALAVTGFLVLPYFQSVRTANLGMFLYISMLACDMIGMQMETCFFFLPMTQKEIRQYLTARMQWMLGGTAALSAGIAAVLKIAGIPIFLERGVFSTFCLLFMIEFMAVIYLYEEREEAIKEEKAHGRAKARKIRGICYLVFGVLFMLYQFTITSFYGESWLKHGKAFIMVDVVCFVFLTFIHADVIRWSGFTKFRKIRKRQLWGYSGVASKEEKEGAAS